MLAHHPAVFRAWKGQRNSDVQWVSMEVLTPAKMKHVPRLTSLECFHTAAI